MSVPSYDDLTPSIPDIASGELVASVERLFSAANRGPEAGDRAPGAGGLGSGGGNRGAGTAAGRIDSAPSQLYACVRAARMADALAVAHEFSPRIQRHGSGAVVLDVSGLERLLGGPDTIGVELERVAAARGSMRVAVAPTQVATLLLSRANPALTVVTADVPRALSDVSLDVLRQVMADVHGVTVWRGRAPTRPIARYLGGGWGSDERLFDVLQRWGLSTLGELAALPPADLAARMGQDGIALQQLARGMDPAPLVPDPGISRFVERLELDWPIDTLEPLAFVLARLLDPLCVALAHADRAAAAIRLDLRLVDRTTHARTLQLPAVIRDPRVLRALLLLDLESHPPRTAVDVVAIELDPAPGRVIQYSLLDRPLPSPETVATLTARLDALVGESRCGTPGLADTHCPDSFEMRRFAPDDRVVPEGRGIMPVPVSGCLRRFRPPIAIRVSVESGRPARVAIDRRSMPGGRIVQAAGPWRTSGGWWDRAAAHWDRDEWDVAFADGAICRLFQQRDTARWFMEGVID